MQQHSGEGEGVNPRLSHAPIPAKAQTPAPAGWQAVWKPQWEETQAWNGLPASLFAAPYLSFDAIMSLTNLQICIEPLI